MLNKNINKIREEKNITIRELSRRTGIAPSVISNIESGKTKNPRINIVCNIAKGLNVSLDILVYGKKR